MTFEPTSRLCLWEKPCTSLKVLLTQMMQRLFMVVYVSGCQVVRPFFFLSSFFLSLFWLPSCFYFLSSFFLSLVWSPSCLLFLLSYFQSPGLPFFFSRERFHSRKSAFFWHFFLALFIVLLLQIVLFKVLKKV